MVTQELIDYVKKQREGGFSDEDISRELKNSGWGQDAIEYAFRGQIIYNAEKFKGVSILLSESWHLFRQRIYTLAGLYIIPALLAGLFIISGLIGGDITDVQNFTWPMVILFFVLVIVLLILTLPIYPAILSNLKESTNIGWKKSYRLGFHYVGPYFWVGALTVFAILGGIYLLVVPGIIMMIWLYFASASVVIEDARGMNALLKSREYTKGKWWATLWRIAVPTTLVFILHLILKILPATAENLTNTILSIFWGPFFIVYQYLLYKELQRTHIPSATPSKKSSFVILATLGILMPIIATALLLLLS